MADESPHLIQYLNTDLDLAARFDLTPLTAALDRNGVFTLHCAPDQNGTWTATFELEGAGIDNDPETTICGLLDAIEKLEPNAREAWNACEKREFNLGYDCGDEPWAFTQGLSVRSISRIAALGMSLRITIYPVRESSP